jgi:hypothetical protein
LFVLAAIVTAMASFDRLIRWLHAKKKAEWVALGSPTGYLFRPEGASFWRSDSKKTELAQRWFFVRPEWISESEELRRALWIYRSAGWCAIVGLIILGFALSR